MAPPRDSTSQCSTIEPEPSLETIAKGRLFKLECEWLQDNSMAVGDHLIMVGRVLNYERCVTRSARVSQLLYSDGKYRSAGELFGRNRSVLDAEHEDRLSHDDLAQRTAACSGVVNVLAR